MLELPAAIDRVSLKFFKRKKDFINTSMVYGDDAEVLFVSVPLKTYLELTDKSNKYEIIFNAYFAVANELFPTNIDEFRRNVNHERILQEVKSMRQIHARSSRLNLLLSIIKNGLKQVQIIVNRLLKECEEF